MTAAIIRVRTPSGMARTFQAERVDVADGLITAAGIWRGTRDRARKTYTWPAGQIIELRWTREPVMA